MTTEWTDLTDIEAVALAKSNGWEIETRSCGVWEEWTGESWTRLWEFRGRPAQPKKVTVTSECWRLDDGTLLWRKPGYNISFPCKRFPAGDITGEVEE